MKLSDYLTDLGRPVAYFPQLARALGDIKETIFICQMAYWRGKEQDPDGWIYKSSEEIEKETALSYKEQLHVRAGLRAKNLLEEYYARTEHVMYFRVDWDAINELWEEHLTKEHMPKSKMPSDKREDSTLLKGSSPTDKLAPGITPKVISLNGISENTAEITPENTREGEAISLQDIWEQVVDQLKPDTPRASFQKHIQDTQTVRFDGNTLEIAAANEEARAWLEDRLTRTAENLLIGIMNASVNVIFVVAETV